METKKTKRRKKQSFSWNQRFLFSTSPDRYATRPAGVPTRWRSSSTVPRRVRQTVPFFLILRGDLQPWLLTGKKIKLRRESVFREVVSLHRRASSKARGPIFLNLTNFRHLAASLYTGFKFSVYDNNGVSFYITSVTFRSAGLNVLYFEMHETEKK